MALSNVLRSKSAVKAKRYTVTLTVEVESRKDISDPQDVADVVTSMLDAVGYPFHRGGITIADVTGIAEAKFVEDVEGE